MYLTIFDSEEKAATDTLTIAPTSLYCTFEQVTDGPKPKGKRYPLPLLLTLLLLRRLAGETSINGIIASCQRTTRLAALSVELAQAVSDQFDVESGIGSL